MVIEQTKSLIHWNYFLALDSDISNLSRYIDFSHDNFAAFSIEMAHLMLAAASEVDVVAKLICKNIDPSAKANNITGYRRLLKKAFPNLSEMKVLMPRYGLKLEPWVNWKSNRTPEWWAYYNKVKHERDRYFKHANMKNTLNAVAALFIMLLHFYINEANKGDLIPSPCLFRVEDRCFAGVDLGSGDVRFVYRIT